MNELNIAFIKISQMSLIEQTVQNNKQLYEAITKALMERLCAKYRYRVKNIRNPSFDFSFDDLKNTNSRHDQQGFGITGCGEEILKHFLLYFHNQNHFINVNLENRIFSITQEGMKYCSKVLEPGM
jgi:hypothetical protein